jgi:hypothetical protein
MNQDVPDEQSTNRFGISAKEAGKEIAYGSVS